MLFTYSVCPKCLKVNKISFDRLEESKPNCGSCHTGLDIQNGVSNLSLNQVKNLIQKSPLPIVIDFWAPWCGPCKMFSPVFTESSSAFKGKIVFVKINTETYPDAGQYFNIRGIPTVSLYKDGKEIVRQAGAMSRDQFSHWLQKNI